MSFGVGEAVEVSFATAAAKEDDLAGAFALTLGSTELEVFVTMLERLGTVLEDGTAEDGAELETKSDKLAIDVVEDVETVPVDVDDAEVEGLTELVVGRGVGF